MSMQHQYPTIPAKIKSYTTKLSPAVIKLCSFIIAAVALTACPPPLGEPPNCLPECSGVDLQGTNLIAVDLSAAELSSANLNEAELDGVDMVQHMNKNLKILTFDR